MLTGQELLARQKLADGSRAAGKLNWELLVAATGCSANDSNSDFYRGIAHVGNCRLQQLAALLKIPALIFYCGIAHKVEYFVY